jgi:putative hemolysin
MLAMLYIELAIIIVLILINGLLALAELAIVASRRARLQALVDRDVPERTRDDRWRHAAG